MKSRQIFFSFLLVALFSLQVFSWGDVGHEVIAEIAWTQMTPKTKKRVQELLNVYKPFYPGASSIAVASRWLDDIKYGLGAFDNWHYININQKNLKKNSMPIPRGPHVIFGICEAVKTLKGNLKDKRPQSAKDFEKATMLRVFLHLVGDIHQPMHCSSLRNKFFEKGDMGGNNYLIQVDKATTNLHLYWDLGLGLYGDVHAKYNPVPVKSDKTDKLVKAIMKEFKKQDLKEKLMDQNLKSWAYDSAKIGFQQARSIKPGQSPSKKYIEENQKIIRERTALAGYRLADLLEKVLDNPGAEVTGCR